MIRSPEDWAKRTDRAEYAFIRRDTLATIIDYVEKAWPPGSFVEAVLCNDLMGAFASADSDNRASLFEISSFIWNEVPRFCWGSRETFEGWPARLRDLEDQMQKERNGKTRPPT